MKVLIACEESQTACLAFRERGHEAYSADLLPCSGGHPEFHITGDCTPLLLGNISFVTDDGKLHHVDQWDLLIAHPPCTYISAVSAPLMFPGGLLNPLRYGKMRDAVEFFYLCLNSNAKRICVENPRPLHIANLPKPDQIVEPYYFGDAYTKRTSLWLKGLPLLKPTCIVVPKKSFVLTCKGSKGRSKSFKGIAYAMATQWHEDVTSNIGTQLSFL